MLEMKNRVSSPSGVTVGASKTAAAVSLPTQISEEQQKNIKVMTVLSAVTRSSAALNLKLQHSPDAGASWFDVGTEGTVNVAASTTVASATDINATTDVITKTSHGFATGDALIFKAGTAAPTGLTDGTTYWFIKVDANSFKLAASQADAYAGTAVDISAVGTGTQTFSKANYEIRMVYSDGTDVAQLPLYPLVRMAVDSSTSDSITVSKVMIGG
jgi:hypothetical protein